MSIVAEALAWVAVLTPAAELLSVPPVTRQTVPMPSINTTAVLRSVPSGLDPPGPTPRVAPSVVSEPPAKTLTRPVVEPPGVPKVNVSVGGRKTASPPTTNEFRKLALEPAPVTVKVPSEPAALPI